MQQKVTFFLFFIGLFIGNVNHAYSQNQDSIAITNHDWQIKKIKKGVVWKKGSFENLFNSKQEINYIEIDLKKHLKNLNLAADSKKLIKTSQFAKANNAIVAINGGFFDMKNGGSVDYIRVNNQVINESKNKSVRANAVFAFSKKDIKITSSDLLEPETAQYANIMLSGPLLITNEEFAPLTKNAFNDNRHPRTAIAITKNHKLILMIVDGRNALANGMNLHELAKTLKWIGAKDAMNLDGGGSSALYIKNENGVVSYPSDNKKFDHEGERSVANIIYLK